MFDVQENRLLPWGRRDEELVRGADRVEFCADQHAYQRLVIQVGCGDGGDLPAVTKHGDMPPDLEDLIEPVSDIKDRHALGGYAPQDVEQAPNLAVGQRGRGLIQNEEFHFPAPTPRRARAMATPARSAAASSPMSVSGANASPKRARSCWARRARLAPPDRSASTRITIPKVKVVDEAGLPRSVGAGKGVDLPWRDGEVEAVERQGAAERL